MRLWYLSHMRPAKAQAIRVVSPEPSLFTHTKYSRKRHDVTNMAPSEKPEVIQMLDYGVNRSLVIITDNG